MTDAIALRDATVGRYWEGFDSSSVRDTAYSFTGDLSILHILKRFVTPKIIIEVGSWKGHSAIAMAKMFPEAHLICVDTFIGSVEHWLRNDWKAQLKLKHGMPQLFFDFVTNVMTEGLHERITPMPMLSDPPQYI